MKTFEDTVYQTPYTRHHISDTVFQTPYFRHRISDTVYRGRTCKAMVERKRTKLQTMIYKTLLIALTITENNR